MILLYCFLAFVLSFLCTPVVIYLMRTLRIVDRPTQKRKIHKKNIPLGGGLAIFLSFFVIIFWGFTNGDLGGDIPLDHMIGVFLGGTFLLLGGVLDDKYTLSPFQQIWFPIIASVVTIAFGIGLESVTSPIGGVLHLNIFSVSLSHLGNFLVLADTLVFFWLMSMMYTTKLLDGMDGLATGIVAIGAMVIFFLSREPQWFQPEVTLVAGVFAASCFGFLIWNFHPAKIFLGEGGSVFLGYILGVLAIISGSKIATTLLVMGVPMLDVVRVIVKRVLKKQSIFVGDSEHLHFRLLDSGLNQRQAVLLLYSIAFAFGISALFLQSHQKLVALSFLFLLMLLVSIWFLRKKTA